MTTSEQLEAQIAEQRRALAETADALSEKLDVSGPPRPVLLGAVAAVVAVAALVWWRRRS